MQIVASTPIVLLLLAILVRLGPNRGLIVLLGVTPFGMMAGVNLPAVGGTSITVTDLAVVTLGLMLLLYRFVPDALGQLFRPGSAGLWLLAFLAYAAFATVFFPRIFEGATEVFAIGRVSDGLGIVIRPLAPNNGNLSQLFRMILSVTAFAAAALILWRWPDSTRVVLAVTVATVVHVVLGLADITTNFLNVEFLLDPIRTANYALTLGQKMAGLNRMIGGYPEASSFGYYSLGVLGFWLAYWYRQPTPSRRTTAMLLLSLFVTLRSTSSSAYVGLALLLSVFVVTRMVSQNSGSLNKRSAGILIGVLALLPVVAASAVVLYEQVQGFTNFIDRSLLNKLSSDSGEERMTWNLQALHNAWDTMLLGAGLGSVRASNWVVAVLATTGLPGVFLIGAFLFRFFRMPLNRLSDEAQTVAFAMKFACAGLLFRALVVKASPNLDIFFFVFAGTCVGLVAAAQRAPQSGTRPRPQSRTSSQSA
jgi:hypothetical protein